MNETIASWAFVKCFCFKIQIQFNYCHKYAADLWPKNEANERTKECNSFFPLIQKVKLSKYTIHTPIQSNPQPTQPDQPTNHTHNIFSLLYIFLVASFLFNNNNNNNNNNNLLHGKLTVYSFVPFLLWFLLITIIIILLLLVITWILRE